jgi:HAMP domain-containing protein
MKLLAKVNLILILLFGAGLALTEYYWYTFLARNAREQVLQQADLMMESAMSTRKYTNEEIKPLLERQLKHSNTFAPQSVPAHAATSTFAFLRPGNYSDYTYREPTLNPTNPADRAVDWEADVINTFRNHTNEKRITGERDTPTGRALFVARPIVAAPACLECHSTANKAPKSMVALYGPSNGFGWHPNEIIGANMVSVPMSVPVERAQKAFRELSIEMVLIFVGTLLALDFALYAFVIRPVRRLSAFADRVSTGETDMPEIPVRGRDEISTLTASFNRMYVSLQKALHMLEG